MAREDEGDDNDDNDVVVQGRQRRCHRCRHCCVVASPLSCSRACEDERAIALVEFGE